MCKIETVDTPGEGTVCTEWFIRTTLSSMSLGEQTAINLESGSLKSLTLCSQAPTQPPEGHFKAP